MIVVVVVVVVVVLRARTQKGHETGLVTLDRAHI